jgi:hypothetical protein
MQASISQNKDQEGDPDPSTQAYREEEHIEVERQDTQSKYIDRHARKPREHLKTWGARLRRRWIEVTGNEHELPLTLKDCQLLHHDLLQADDETFEKIIPQEDDSGSSTQGYREEESSKVSPRGEYTSGEHFRSIYHEKGKTYATGAYEVKEVIVEPPHDEIKFLERNQDPARSHPSKKHLTTWEAIIPSYKNPAYAFNI